MTDKRATIIGVILTAVLTLSLIGYSARQHSRFVHTEKMECIKHAQTASDAVLCRATVNR